MGKREYPRLDHTTKGGAGGECDCCDQRSTHTVWVQFDWMRGNDEKFAACARHMKMAQKDFGRFMAHHRSKEKFLKRAAYDVADAMLAAREQK